MSTLLIRKRTGLGLLALAAAAAGIAAAQNNTGSRVITTFGGAGQDAAATISVDLKLTEIHGIATDNSGNVYVARAKDVLRITRAGAVTRFAGGGAFPPATIGSRPASSVGFVNISAIATDASGAVYVADFESDSVSVILRIAGGTAERLAGSRSQVTATAPALGSRLARIQGLAANAINVFFTQPDGRVRVVSDGSLGTVAGIEGQSADGPDGLPGPQTALNGPSGLALDGNFLLIAQANSCAVRRVNLATNIADTLTGTGAGFSCGNGGAAAVAVRAGTVFFGRNARIFQVAGGVVTPFAGTGQVNNIFAVGDGGPPEQARLPREMSLAVDAGNDRVYVSVAVASADSGLPVRAITTERVGLSLSRNFTGGDFAPLVDGVAVSNPDFVPVIPGLAHTADFPQIVVTSTNTRHRFGSFPGGGGVPTPGGGFIPKVTRMIGWSVISNIAAVYVAQHRVTVAVGTAGAGQVTGRVVGASSPAIRIQTEVSAFFDAGATVELTALPNEGFKFQNFFSAGGLAPNSPFNLVVAAPRTITANFSANAGFTPIRFNAGGPLLSDSLGQTWAADETGFKISTSEQILGTPDPALYQNARRSTLVTPAQGGTPLNLPVTYQFDVPNLGSYNLRLKFADFQSTAAGQRKFNVLVNGSAVLTNFDIFAEAGGRARAIDKLFAVSPPASGRITVTFVSGPGGDAIINAVQLISNAVGVTVSPGHVTLNGGQTAAFTSTVAGAEDRRVTWKIEPEVGSISDEGVFTAPASIDRRQTVTVTATSRADTTKLARATVQLSPPWTLTSSAGVAFSSQPLNGDGSVIAHVNRDGAAASLEPGVMIRASAGPGAPFAFVGLGQGLRAVSRFRASEGSADSTVESGSGIRWVRLTRVGDQFTPYHSLDGITWSPGPSFSIAMPANGVLAGLAILNAEGGGDEADPARSALFDNAAITGPAAIELSHRMGSLAAGQSLQLEAKVTGVADSGVAWSLSPNVGSITSSGLYQAPADAAEAPRTVTIMASSMADPAVQAKATFQVGAFQPILINAGGEALNGGGEGSSFAGDAGFEGGQANRANLAALEETELADLYRTSRSSSQPFDYRFALPNGDYTVRLHFIETEATQAGQRRFDIRVNGVTAQERFDIFAQAGGMNKPLVRQFAARVENGELRLSFIPAGGEATINGIEIVE